MSAHKPKLEVFKINVRKKQDDTSATFRDLFRSIAPAPVGTKNNPIKPEDILKSYREKFVNYFDTEGFFTDKTKNTAFSLPKNAEGTPVAILHSTKQVIDGVLKGGKFNVSREVSEVKNKANSTPVGEDKVVTDTYYYLIHTPLNGSSGLLMLQTYSEGSIKADFIKHLKTFFGKEGIYKVDVESFFPNDFKETFIKGSYVKSINMHTNTLIPVDLNETSVEVARNFMLKIELIDKDENPLKASEISSILPSILKRIGIVRKINHASKETLFEEFPDTKVYLAKKVGKEERKTQYDLNEQLDIKPTMYLDENQVLQKNGIPDFESMRKFCLAKLAIYIKEIDPSNEVEELA
jgi:hypothetical protein